MATLMAEHTREVATMDVETAEEDSPAIFPAASAPARSGWRLGAGVAGALLVVVAVAAVATGSPSAERGVGARSECEGLSCMTRSDHLDKVLTMKQNTMQPGDCPAGYTGTVLNIEGAGKQWSRGDLAACKSTCDSREGCKGFEFHPSNGKCGTYLDGYVLHGKEFYGWLTCIKDEAYRQRALTLSGGGFLAYSNFAALAAGLLAFSRGQGAPYATNFAELFRTFGSVVGISGGAWFQSHFVYSKSFEDLLNELADYAQAGTPEQAVDVFNKAVGNSLFPGDYSKINEKAIMCMMETAVLVNPSLSPAVEEAKQMMQGAMAAAGAGATEEVKKNKLLELLPAIKQKATQIGIHPLYQTYALEAMVLLSENDNYVTWDTAMAAFFERVAKIERNVTLGSTTINKWAEGKVMISGATLPFAGPTQPAVAYHDASGGSMFYTTPMAGGAQIENDQVPVKFSYALSSSSSDESGLASSMPFCAQPDCFGGTVAYSGAPGGNGHKVQSSLGEQIQASFESKAAKLPVSSVAAASSALEWVRGLFGFDGTSRCFDLAVWADNSEEGPFSSATELRKGLFGTAVTADNLDESTKKLADAGLIALGSASASDSTGIATAIAAKATFVTSWMFVDVTDAPEGKEHERYGYLSSHFRISDSDDQAPRVIFAQPEGDAVYSAIRAFDRILPLDDAKFLKAIAYGTIECTTVDNKWQGIEAGQSVSVNVIAVETKEKTIGLLQDDYEFSSFDDYGALVKEILGALMASGNSDKVKAIVDRFFNAYQP